MGSCFFWSSNYLFLNFMLIILSIIFFIFGIIIGSFLNVVILRYNTERNLGGRSACMSCRNTLAWYELVPLFSYIFQRGRCMNCKTKISAQYPIVEFITGILFMALFLKFQDVFSQSTFVFALSYAYYATIFS